VQPLVLAHMTPRVPLCLYPQFKKWKKKQLSAAQKNKDKNKDKYPYQALYIIQNKTSKHKNPNSCGTFYFEIYFYNITSLIIKYYVKIRSPLSIAFCAANLLPGILYTVFFT
jgi:hypothetical protein